MKEPTHPILPFSNLEDSEFLSTSTLHHLSLNLVMNDILLDLRLPVLPIRAEGCDELHVINHMVSMIKHVSHSIHFQPTRRELCMWRERDAFVRGSLCYADL